MFVSLKAKMFISYADRGARVIVYACVGMSFKVDICLCCKASELTFPRLLMEHSD